MSGVGRVPRQQRLHADPQGASAGCGGAERPPGTNGRRTAAATTAGTAVGMCENPWAMVVPQGGPDPHQPGLI